MQFYKRSTNKYYIYKKIHNNIYLYSIYAVVDQRVEPISFDYRILSNFFIN